MAASTAAKSQSVARPNRRGCGNRPSFVSRHTVLGCRSNIRASVRARTNLRPCVSPTAISGFICAQATPPTQGVHEKLRDTKPLEDQHVVIPVCWSLLVVLTRRMYFRRSIRRIHVRASVPAGPPKGGVEWGAFVRRGGPRRWREQRSCQRR